MTNEEALNSLCDDCVHYPCYALKHGDNCWAYNTIKKALEKQIPKKPEEYWDGYYDGYPVIEYKCPCCGRDIDDTEHHCVCGQKLDWSEEDG